MQDKTSAVREFLITTARRKKLTNYTEAGRVADLDMAAESGRILIAKILDDINTIEAAEGAPMISALVLYQTEKRPGPGFFTCARTLGKLTNSDEDGFWAREVSAVFEWWKTH